MEQRRGIADLTTIRTSKLWAHYQCVNPNAVCADRPTQMEPPHGRGPRLAAFNDGFDDIRRQIAEPQQPPDMGIVELFV
jgi:hypothetical protein